jgi:hypothetical protein
MNSKLINIVIERVGDYISITADGETIIAGKCPMFTQERAGEIDVLPLEVKDE